MSEQKSNRCFVLLPPSDPQYLRLFDELFAPAITRAGLVSYLIEQSPADALSLDAFVHEIAQADAIFADLSRNDIDIWFAVGCALTLKKPLCLVSSAPVSNLPFDIQGLEIISYPGVPFPSDYSELEQAITTQLSATLPEKLPYAIDIPATDLYPNWIQPPATPIIAPAINASPTLPLSVDLTAHEALALTIINRGSEHGLSPRELGLEMKESDSAHLTSHAMSSLRRRKLIEKRSVQISEGNESYISENLFITRSGESWLLRHNKLKRRAQPVPDSRELFLSSR